MSIAPAGSDNPLLKRVAWVLAVAALLSAVMAIYLLLRPTPRRLADPEEFVLSDEQPFTLDDLPMGGRYRLRACDRSAELRATLGRWSSGWVQVRPDPLDDRQRDLAIDGRGGGTLRIEARAPTGRLILFREGLAVTCRGVDPRDVGFAASRRAQRLPPFECDEEALAGHDREVLELLRREFTTPSPTGSSHAVPPLSEAEQSCLTRIQELERMAGPGAIPASSQATPVPDGSDETAPPLSSPAASRADSGLETASPSSSSSDRSPDPMPSLSPTRASSP